MNEIIIKAGSSNQAEIIAKTIRSANEVVAERFSLNRENCSKHPSFCDKSWVLNDIERGAKYLTILENGEIVGCVSYEKNKDGIAFLNRLAVIPEKQYKGYGKKLVNSCIEKGRMDCQKKISIGIIAAHTELADWYKHLGFVQGAMKKFPHLPFDVLYLTYEIKRD